MPVSHPTAEGHDENYSSESPEPSEPSPISTPPKNLNTIEGWETPHTRMDDNTFYSDDELPRIYFLPSSSSPQLPPRKLKQKLSLGMPFLKRGGVLEHVCEACGQSLPEPKDTTLVVNKLKTPD